MSRQALVLDGLWYSLCPSFSQLTLRRSAPLLRPRQRCSKKSSPPTIRSAAPTPAPILTSRRYYSSDTRSSDRFGIDKGTSVSETPRNASSRLPTPPLPSNAHESTTTVDMDEPVKPYCIGEGKSVTENSQDAASPRSDSQVPFNKSPKPKGRSRAPKKQYEQLWKKSQSELEAILQGEENPGFVGTIEALRALIRDRHVKPRARHYKAMIQANTDNTLGSVNSVHHLLQEMEDNDITADSGTLHAALQVGYGSWKPDSSGFELY